MKKFRVKDRKFQRIIAATVCLVMVLGLVFQVNLLSAPETEQPKPEKAVTRVADESTMDGWKEFFLEEKDTSNAGKIWTDKTVVDGDINLTSPNGDGEKILISRKDKENSDNFMVSLSALSSSKTLTLEAAIPVDVMFTVDISGSMKRDKAIALVDALNKSIHDILSMNDQNRVGVVFYSGSYSEELPLKTTAHCVFPLDRYTTIGTEYFLTSNGNTIQISKNVKNEKEEPMYDEKTPSYAVRGSTYTQNGLLQAFENMSAQSSDNKENRIPIITLMSDGAPTAASEQYTVSADATMGVGDETDIPMTFLTQLTAAWVKKNLEKAYNNVKPLFYTVGLLPEGPQKEYARLVLDPKNNEEDSINLKTELGKWWETFFSAEENTEVTLGKGTSEQIIVQKKDNLLIPSENSQYYVDDYFEANGAEGLKTAFEKLVKKIRVQSAESPTDVLPTEKKEDLNYSGYLVFEDDLGKYMSVEHVAGVTYAGNLHTGIGFAEKMDAERGTATDVERKKFIDSLRIRLGISEQEAQELFENAQTTGQILYKGVQKEASNYIGWYSNVDKNYVAPYVNGKEIPSDAKFINKSFFYYGNSKDTISEERMMYLGVRIEEDIETKEQKMYFFIPASLLPLVKYNMTATSKEPDKIQVEKEQAYPVRLFYEVGLKNGIDEYNLEQAESDLIYTENKQGRIGTFYQSFWPVKGENAEAATYVDFTPSNNNEYYYYTEDTPIYIKGDGTDEYQLYQQDTRPSTTDGNKYYFEKSVGKIGETLKEQKFPLPEKVFDKISESKNEDGNWIIPKGIFKEEVLGEVQKNSTEIPNTDTASYVSKTTINEQMTLNTGQKNIRDFLGNNGKIVFRQGKIIVSKEVTIIDGLPDEKPPEDASFCFEMQFKNQSVKFELKNGQSQGYWLPIGEKVSVEEKLNDKDPYKVMMTVTQNDQTGEQVETKKIESLQILLQSQLEVHVENQYHPPSILIGFYKRDENRKPLGDAEFNLYKLECKDSSHAQMHEKQVLAMDESPECWKLISSAKSDEQEDGWIPFFNESNEDIRFEQGIYRLVEEKAPNGYVKPMGEWNLKVFMDTETSQKSAKPVKGEAVLGAKGEKPPALIILEHEVEITNYKPIDPPITGGRGIDRFLILGAAVTVGGLMLTVHLILQRRRGKI